MKLCNYKIARRATTRAMRMQHDANSIKEGGVITNPVPHCLGKKRKKQPPSRIRGSRWYSETGEWYSETGGGIRKLRFGNWRWYSGTSEWYSETGKWYSETGEWYSETGGGIRKLRFGNWRWYSETGKWYSETGKWYSETGEWYSETGNGFPKLVFRNWKHCIRKLASGIPKLEGSIRKLGVVFGNSFSDTRTLDLGHEGEAQILLNVFARGGGGF